MRRILVWVAMAGLVAGCGGGSSSPTSPSQSSGSSEPTVAGTWKATRAEYTSLANSGLRVDVVAQGSTVTLVIETGSFTLTIADPGLPGNVTTGSWTASRDTMTFTPAGMPFSWVFDYTLSGNTLSLSGAHVEFDFAENGVMQQATLTLVLTRQ